MASVGELTTAAEREWLERWTAGPAEAEGSGLATGTAGPELVLADHTGTPRTLSEVLVRGPGTGAVLAPSAAVAALSERSV